MSPLHLQIANDFAALGPASAAMREHLAAAAAPDAAVFLAELVLEELVTNTIKYGYDHPGPRLIHARIDYSAGQLTVEIGDDGHPFDPLAQAAPDLTLPAEERGLGGLGLHLVRQMTDTLTYERQENRNQVTAKKTFEKQVPRRRPKNPKSKIQNPKSE